jgi:5,10-methylenetetrahydrofolate reductase
MEPIKSFLKEIKKFRIPILVGLFPCKSYGVANFFDKHIPGVHVPKEYMEELKKTATIEDKRKKRKKYDEINLEFCLKFIKELKKTTHTSGIHIMAVGYERLVRQIVESIQ